MESFGIIKSDIHRVLISGKIVIGIIATLIILTFSLFGEQLTGVNVLYVFIFVMDGMPAMLILMAASYGYADSICSDIEHCYLRCLLIRTQLKKYVFAKVLVIFLSSLIITSFGILLFVVVMRFFLPWIGTSDSMYEVFSETGCFCDLLKKGNYVLYFLLCGVKYGLLSGVLSVFAAYISLFVSNRMIVIIFPFIGRYLLDGISMSVTSEYTVSSFFWSANKLFESEAVSLLTAMILVLVLLSFLGFLMTKKIKKDYLE